jgi:hypothetical protein
MTAQTETLDTFMDVDAIALPEGGTAYRVIHPLYDAPEAKCNADHLGPLKLSRGCRIALGAVRFYIVAIMLMGGYRILELVGAVK